MKKFICIALVFILSFGLIACNYTTTNEDGIETKGFFNYVVIEENIDNNGFEYWVVYDKTNFVCYDISNPHYDNRTITPHLTVKDGTVYYTLYEDGNFKIAPMAVFTDSMFQMIKGFLN